MLWERPTAAASAMTSRENSDSSMPGWPCVTPSHIAGTPPATCATPPASRAAWRMISGKRRSEEHTSELQSLMRISYAVFCLKKKKTKNQHTDTKPQNDNTQYNNKPNKTSA